METKRQNNTTGLKVKFLPVTNTKPSRYKITQTNSGKSVIIGADFNVPPIEHFVNVLNGLEELRSFSLVVDNTQNDYYLFSLDFAGDSFENILNYFK
jgi:hypothetical protein